MNAGDLQPGAVVDMPTAAAGRAGLVDLLSGGDGGWQLAPLVEWLFTIGQHVSPMTRLLDELCARLLEAGVPVWRVRLSIHTLHPQVAAWSVTWWRGCTSSEYRIMHGIEESDAFIGSPIQAALSTGAPVRHRLDRLDPERDHAVLLELAAAGARDYVALPLSSWGRPTGVLIVATDRQQGFADTDLVRFELLGRFLAPVLEVEAQRRIAQGVLDTYVGRRTGAKVLAGLIRRGDSEMIDAALWFSDLRDSTLLTERLPAERLLALLNTYFEVIAAAAEAHGGEILRIIGDAMLIVFPTDGRRDMAAACAAALDAAQDATSAMAPINHRRVRQGEPAVRFGVGLHVGTVYYGNIGAPARLDFTVIGAAVNMAARLESLTKQTGEPVLMSAEFARTAGRPATSVGYFELKGLEGTRELFVPGAEDGDEVARVAGPPAD